MGLAKFAILAIIITASPVAFAQTSESQTKDTTTKSAAAETQANPVDLQRQVTTSLEQAGFSGVKVMPTPDSFLVRAANKSGDGVTMFVNPDPTVAFPKADADNQNTGTISSEMFATIPSSDRLSSSVVGLEVYNNENQDIGTIKDVALDKSGLRAYIVGVGGFLGMGEHYVAVRPSGVNLSYNAGEKKWHALMKATAAQLKDAPEYKYPSKL
jgi:hypothetical protein